jgi:hypothetical protein
MSCGNKSCSSRARFSISLEFSKHYLLGEPGDLAIGALGKHRGVCVQTREMEAARYGKRTDTTRISSNCAARQFGPVGGVCGAFLGRIFILEYEGLDGEAPYECGNE